MARKPPAADVFALRDQGRKVRIWGVDVTNHCDAACWYCPHPTHKRARGFIDPDTFQAVLDVCENDRFNLHFFSEPLLHKGLEELIAMAADQGFDVGFSTNGRLLTQARLDSLAAAGLRWLRLHVNAHRKRDQPFGVRVHDFTTPDGLLFTEHKVGDADGQMEDVWDKGLTGQGGHLDLGARGGASRCSYLGTYGDGVPWSVVLWDGRFAMCCVDIEGSFDPDQCNTCQGVVFDSPEIIGDPTGTGDLPDEMGYLEAT
jgi:hypothetical protein